MVIWIPIHINTYTPKDRRAVRHSCRRPPHFSYEKSAMEDADDIDCHTGSHDPMSSYGVCSSGPRWCPVCIKSTKSAAVPIRDNHEFLLYFLRVSHAWHSIESPSQIWCTLSHPSHYKTCNPHCKTHRDNQVVAVAEGTHTHTPSNVNDVVTRHGQ
jgi:hypothetical protein